MLALLAALLGPATAPALGQDGIAALGLNDLRSDGIMLPNAEYSGAADLDLADGAGVRLYRGRLRLDCLDPSGTGTFDFSRPLPACSGLSYDDLVGALAARGMTYLPILINFGTVGGRGYVPVPPTVDGVGGSPTRARFAAFAAAAARRYGPDGTFWEACGCTPRPIRAWEVWNEENNGWWWGGNASAQDYVAVFDEVRGALRSADPQARAIVGGVVWDRNGERSFVAPESLVAALAAGNPNRFDAVAIHPYTDARGATARALAHDAGKLVERMATALRCLTGPGRNGAPRQQIWITEMGWSDTDAPPNTIADGMRQFLTWLGSGTRLARSVGPVLWYMLRDNGAKGARDDQLGLRWTSPTGADAGAKAVWSTFADLAQRTRMVSMPAALRDAPPRQATACAGPCAPPRGHEPRPRGRGTSHRRPTATRSKTTCRALSSRRAAR
jgi:hypothetical protein